MIIPKYNRRVIKAFLFDYGGVMTAPEIGATSPSERLAQTLGIGTHDAWQLLRPGWNKLLRGQITEEALWANIEKLLGKPIKKSDRAIWNKWDQMKPLSEMIELLQRLKGRGYTIGLLSNVPMHTATDIRGHGGYDSFDFSVLSYEVGYAKPEIEIYQAALTKLSGMQPQEIVFVDDRKPLLEPAQKLGMHTILAKTPQQIADDIASLTRS